MVTEVPIVPELGVKLVMLGGGTIVKLTPLLARPPTVTTTLPVVAPEGAGAAMLVGLQIVGVAAIPLNVTMLVPCNVPKFVPAIVTDVPTAPELGVKLVMLGRTRTVKLIPLLAKPPTVTTTLPVVAPAGTGTTMFVAPQLVGVAAVPLNVTVLVPCVAPKFVPVIVTGVPAVPDVKLRLDMLGAVPPPPLAARNAARTAPQVSDEPSVALADAVPAETWIRSSTINFELGSAGALSSVVKPLPDVKFAGFAAEMDASSKSPFDTVAAFPLFGDVLVPWPVAVVSREFAGAIPEYSRIAKRIVPKMVSVTVTVFAPPEMFSA
jgi:hypothetical protein